jgi:hypothetical protein
LARVADAASGYRGAFTLAFAKLGAYRIEAQKDADIALVNAEQERVIIAGVRLADVGQHAVAHAARNRVAHQIVIQEARRAEVESVLSRAG